MSNCRSSKFLAATITRSSRAERELPARTCQPVVNPLALTKSSDNQTRFKPHFRRHRFLYGRSSYCQLLAIRPAAIPISTSCFDDTHRSLRPSTFVTSFHRLTRLPRRILMTCRILMAWQPPNTQIRPSKRTRTNRVAYVLAVGIRVLSCAIGLC